MEKDNLPKVDTDADEFMSFVVTGDDMTPEQKAYLEEYKKALQEFVEGAYERIKREFE